MGVVVTNVETALNVLDAADGHPVTDKYVTVTGAVRGPKTVKVPLGITVAEALELAGGPTVPDYRIVNGGPMMGRLVSPESVITKTTKGLIVVPAGHPLLNSLERPLNVSLRQAAAACMQCSLCSEVCPRGLLGHRIQPHKRKHVRSGPDAYERLSLLRLPSVRVCLCDGAAALEAERQP